MNQVVLDLWPVIIPVILTALFGLYSYFRKKLERHESDISVILEKLRNLEENQKRMDGRIDRKSQQFDDLKDEMSGLRNDLAEIKGDVKSLMSELKISLDILKDRV